MEDFCLSLELDLNHWFIIFSTDDFERPMFNVLLDGDVVEFSSNESFGVEDCVIWVSGGLIFSRVTDKSFFVGEGDIGGSGSVSLVVGDNFYLFI